MAHHRKSDGVRLIPFDDVEYADFCRRHVVEYARQRVNAGEWSAEEGPERAKKELMALLSDSLRGVGHSFLKAIDLKDGRVGWLWVAPAPAFLEEPRDRKRWLCQITVEETRRRQGYGSAMLAALHDWLGEQRVDELWLRVYDWNEEARRLYERAGYEVMRRFPTDAHLRRRLGMD